MVGINEVYLAKYLKWVFGQFGTMISPYFFDIVNHDSLLA